MEYIRIKKDCETCLAGALFTRKEVEKTMEKFKKSRRADDRQFLLDIQKNGEFVNINRKETFYCFGVRFAE